MLPSRTMIRFWIEPPLDVEGARLPARGDPLQDVGQAHRPEVAAKAHGSAGRRAQLSSQERSQKR